jgi:poly-gamma-glutamate capsule biosynthesis protein CapA/YwtB (metallophosphatase superfamily)/outer membrane protein assembly factor BamB
VKVPVRRILSLAALCVLLPTGPWACGLERVEPGSGAEGETPAATTYLAPGACLVIQRDLWQEEGAFFTALLSLYPSCSAGPVENAALAMELLHSGQAELAVLSGPAPGADATLLRSEPFVFVSHVTSPLEDAPLQWLRDLFSEGGLYTAVVVGDGLATMEVLGIDHIETQALHVSSWREARELVQGNRGLVSLLPWSEVGPQVRALPIDGSSLVGWDPDDYPYQRRWWLAGDLDAHPELSQALVEGLQAGAEPVVSLVAVGDVMLGRGVGRLIAANSPSYPFSAMNDLTSQADLAFGNLESPITAQGSPQGGIALRSRPEVAEGLRQAGFDVLSLANNHILDYGRVGLLDTMFYLDGEGIAYVGVGGEGGEGQSAVILEVKGLRIAFLAYNHVGLPEETLTGDGVGGPAWLEPESAYADIVKAGEDADFVVVSVHWGEEYSPVPDEWQREVARGMLDAGAGLVIGHHPHVVGAVAFEERGFVAYSLGNFVFDQPFSQETQQGLVLLGLIDRSGLKQIRLVPVLIEAGQPGALPPPEARSVLSKLFEVSGAGGGVPGEVGTPTYGSERSEGLEVAWSQAWGERARVVRACDLDGDQRPEIALGMGSPGGPSALYVLDAEGGIAWESDLQGQVNDLECGDVDGDGTNEIVVATGLLNEPGEVVTLDSRGQIGWSFGTEASVLDVELGGLGGNAARPVVAGEWGAFGDTIYVLNGDGSLRWKHPTDGSVQCVAVGDLDGDGSEEVMAGADDVYVLSSDGTLRWRYPSGGYVRRLLLGPPTNDQSGLVLSLIDYPAPSILALGAQGSLSWRFDLSSSPTAALLTGMSDDEQYLLAGSADGTVCSLARDGSLHWRTQMGGPVSDVALGDVNADGISEVVVGTGDSFSSGGIYVLDISTGAVLAFYEERDGVGALDVAELDAQAGEEIVSGSASGEITLLRWVRQ